MSHTSRLGVSTGNLLRGLLGEAVEARAGYVIVRGQGRSCGDEAIGGKMPPASSGTEAARVRLTPSVPDRKLVE